MHSILGRFVLGFLEYPAHFEVPFAARFFQMDKPLSPSIPAPLERSSGNVGIFLLVLFAGAVGGILAFAGGLASNGLLGPFKDNGKFVQLALHAGLGGLTAAVFVFLVANSDRNDRVRAICLAMLVGVFWDPALAGARAVFIDRKEQPTFVAKAEASAEKILGSAADGPSAQPSIAFSDADYVDFLESLSVAKGKVDLPVLTRELDQSETIARALEAAKDQPWYDNRIDALRREFPNLQLP